VQGKIYRPFSQKFNLSCRSYSFPLQRVLTDFGADASFAEAAKKVKEHYGIEVPPLSIENITLKHAEKISVWIPKGAKQEAKILVAEMDGGMVPIVEVDSKAEGDQRRTRKVSWKEAKLCFARKQNEVSRIYGAVIGSPEEAGEKLRKCAERLGLTETTYVHGLGDGAPWIIGEFDNQFGTQAHFLIDFFHMSEYLGATAIWCDSQKPDKWVEERKKMMKEGKEKEVLKELKARRLYLQDLPEENALDKGIKYIEKRIDLMNYKKAREKELPIGSGEIESSHRHIVQRRLKLPGAWWKEETANAMLQLRTARANNDWEAYWKAQKRAA